MNDISTRGLDIFAAGSLQLDLEAELLSSPTVGAKRPVRLTPRAGGAPLHIARALRHGGYRTVLFGSQHPMLHTWLSTEISKLGATALLRPRTDALGASIILPSEADGSEVLVQRATLRREDLVDEVKKQIRGAKLVVAAAMAVENADTPAVVHEIGHLSSGDSVLMPHPTLIAHESFREVARRYRCVIMNAHEAALLSPGRPGVSFAAVKLRYILGDRSEFLITNGHREGLQYAGGNWRTIVPHKIGKCPNDVGAGDTFSAHYAEGRYLRGLEPSLALERALAGVALYLQARYRPVRSSPSATASLRGAAARYKATPSAAPQLAHSYNRWLF